MFKDAVRGRADLRQEVHVYDAVRGRADLRQEDHVPRASGSSSILARIGIERRRPISLR